MQIYFDDTISADGNFDTPSNWWTDNIATNAYGQIPQDNDICILSINCSTVPTLNADPASNLTVTFDIYCAATISDGTWDGAILYAGGIITGGNFDGEFINYDIQVNGGIFTGIYNTFYRDVTSATITGSGNTFEANVSYVTCSGDSTKFYGGVYSGDFSSYGYENHGTIFDGSFTCPMTNYGTISGGTFVNQVFNYGSVTGGWVSSPGFSNYSGATVSGGLFTGPSFSQNNFATISGGQYNPTGSIYYAILIVDGFLQVSESNIYKNVGFASDHYDPQVHIIDPPSGGGTTIIGSILL